MSRPANPLPQLRRTDWMKDPAAGQIFAAIEDAGGTARFVGGCVRNHIRDWPIRDIDIATDLEPAETTAAAEAADIRAIPTGLKHGTVTLVLNHKSFEVTTLRRDVETDGRHAVVAYSKDWAEDAERRDFTMNAIYMGLDGDLLDPVGGYDDAISGYVRFVGDAETRIQEDYLRILRFFRFIAQIGSEEIDQIGLEACRDNAGGLRKLSGERIRSEILRLLEAQKPAPAVALMFENRILQQIDESFQSADLLVELLKQETSIDPVLRLATLISGNDHQLVEMLRFSKSEELRLLDLINERWTFPDDEADLKLLLYTHGKAKFSDHLRIECARKNVSAEAAERAWELANTWDVPAFPLRGQDLLDAGLKPGTEVGDLLKRIEGWWIADGYRADKDACKRKFKL